MQDLDGIKDELEKIRKELDEITRTMLSTEEDRDMWKRFFEECNKKQSEEIERLRRDYKERMALTTSVEKVIPARSGPRGQSPMQLLTPQEMSQTTETRLPTTTGRVTIPDPSDTLGDPVVEQTARRLIETAGRLVANKNAPGPGVTAPYGTIDDESKKYIKTERDNPSWLRRLIETAGRLVANKNAPGSGVTAPYGTIDDESKKYIKTERDNPSGLRRLIETA